MAVADVKLLLQFLSQTPFACVIGHAELDSCAKRRSRGGRVNKSCRLAGLEDCADAAVQRFSEYEISKLVRRATA